MCRQHKVGRSRRGGYTLLEVLLAMAIAVMLLAALYAAMSVQLHHAEAGRDVVTQATLARSLLSRIRQDIAGATNLPDASRYRLQNGQGGGSGQSGASGGAGTSGTSGTSGATGATGATGSGSASGSGTSSSSSDTTSGSGLVAADGTAITWVYGIQGDSANLNLFVSKLPRELMSPSVLLSGTQDDGSPVTPVGDLRRVSYWMADAANGLARQEVKVETAQNMAALAPNVSDDGTGTIKYTPEVRSINFSYFDGTNWNDTWDSTTLGADGITPIGPPRAVAVTIEVVQPGPNGAERVKSYRHVVFIPSANGTTAMQQPAGNTQNSGSGN
jgi:prepilin-type N-terminal cleavage/methylation domain-containing protein